jgi:hypothetical protein
MRFMKEKDSPSGPFLSFIFLLSKKENNQWEGIAR